MSVDLKPGYFRTPSLRRHLQVALSASFLFLPFSPPTQRWAPLGGANRPVSKIKTRL